MKGKAYANRKKESDRPEGDFYSTPKSLIWLMKSVIQEEFKNPMILEPCSGLNAISDELKEMGYSIVTNDLFYTNADFNKDYLESDFSYKQIITNPPFSLWDDFVNKAKTHCNKFMFLGRGNYLGTASRLNSGIWNNLKSIYFFNRYVDYRTPYREDGKFQVGAMLTGWFLWDMNYDNKGVFQTHIIDVNKYVKKVKK